MEISSAVALEIANRRWPPTGAHVLLTAPRMRLGDQETDALLTICEQTSYSAVIRCLAERCAFEGAGNAARQIHWDRVVLALDAAARGLEALDR